MKVDVVRPDELAPSHRARWLEIQSQDDQLSSPFLSPHFAMAVGRVRGNTRVAILSDSTGIAGFFPFERARAGVGFALAKGLSDVQGLVAPHAARVDFAEVVRACGLRLFDFDHLLATQEAWLKGPSSRFVRERSAAIDLSAGFDAYLSRQRSVSSSLFQSTGRKRRKLEREHGPVRLVFDEADHALLDRVLRWKSEQYRRTGRVDRFANPSTRSLVHDLLDVRDATFGAPLNALLAGETVVAGHLGLRSSTTLAWWFPVYDPEYSSYSPGLVMCVELARAMAEQGLSLLDFGKGDEPYKERFSNTEIRLLRGSVARDQLTARLDVARRWPREKATSLVLGSPRLRGWARTSLAHAGALRERWGVGRRPTAIG